MSEIEYWVEMLNRECPDIEEGSCKRIAELLQERLDVAEELYNINRHLSIALMNNQGISAHSKRLNLHLAGLIKKLRGNL